MDQFPIQSSTRAFCSVRHCLTVCVCSLRHYFPTLFRNNRSGGATCDISAGPYWAFFARTQSLPSHPPGLRGTRRACRDSLGCSCGSDCRSSWNDVSKLGNDNSDHILLAASDTANDIVLQSSLLLDHRIRGDPLVHKQVPLQWLHEFAGHLFLCFIDRLRLVSNGSSMV